MINDILAGSNIGALEQMAAFAEARHALLAGTISNHDTPAYKTRDRLRNNARKDKSNPATKEFSPPMKAIQCGM